MFSRLAERRLRSVKKIRQSRGDVTLRVPLAVWTQMVFDRRGGELLFRRRLRRGFAKNRSIDRTDYISNYHHYISVTFYSQVIFLSIHLFVFLPSIQPSIHPSILFILFILFYSILFHSIY